MKILNNSLFTELQNTATASTRGRSHHILHPEPEDSVQRMCVAVNPGSYIQPHRHANPAKWELFLIIKGSASILTFDNKGEVTQKTDLDPNGPSHAVEIPENTWHTLVCHAKDTILVEVKPGPYTPLTDKDFAPWAPKEGDESVIEFEKQMRTAKVGDRFTSK